ncbi:MAG: glycosyltransferase family 39 protein [Planctomycetales bacterium]|nr:glycosyltransferase family 39 protein [Planctomycetales bacterium]MBN8626618.1 glycosyltransferase family 39 protein [Planctomycetota bacterium]
MLTTRAALLLLLAATLGQQTWYVSRAVLPAQDAVDFVSVAQRIEREGFLATVRAEPVPPLFPASICVVHRTLMRCGIIESRQWGRAAQWAAACALVAAVVPAFLFARRLVDPLAACCGTLVFFSLPEVARLGADGTSDALHLFFAATALWSLAAMPDVVESRLWRWSLLCGACLGAALLVRSEMLVVAAVMLVVGLAAFVVSRPAGFRRRGLVAACGLGIFTAVAPYLASGISDPLDLARRLRGGGAPTEETPLNAAVAEPMMGAAVQSPAEPRLGKKDPTRSIRFHGFLATVAEFAKELAQASAYLFVPAACYGAWALRRRQGNWRPADRLAATFIAGLAVAIFAVAWRGGYLSSRHLLLPLLVMMPYAGIAAARLTESTVAALGDLSHAGGDWEPATRGYVTVVAAVMVAQFLTYSDPEPAHESQSAHRDAARWLDSYAAAPGHVLDQQGFTALSSGRVTYRFEAAEQALADERLAYVLLERADLDAQSPRGGQLRKLLGDAAESVAQFSDPRGKSERDVLVFSRLRPESPKSSINVPLTTVQQNRTSHAR